MAKQQIQRKEINKFVGMITFTDPFNIPEGAAVNQINLVATDEGSLNARSGFKPVKFEEVE